MPPGGCIKLRQGERVRILELDDPTPVFVRFVPLLFEQLRGTITPEEMGKFARHELLMKTAKTVADYCNKNSNIFFVEAFRLVREST